MNPEISDPEQELTALLRQRDLRGVATRTVEVYGSELLRFLVAVMGNKDDAQDAFAQTCEDFWASLPQFEARCSVRTWLYTLARHAVARFGRAPHRRPERRLQLSQAPEIAEQVRVTTAAYLRTEVKDRFRAIRDALDADDLALLVLRVDRRMAWDEIVQILAPEDDSDPAVRRASARLRKRFQLLKQAIRVRALEAGLFQRPSEP